MIPKRNSTGVLPPISPGAAGHSSERSPYQVTMSEFVDEFAFSEKRRAILNGLLNYREALYRLGITNGFQWINGSFIEDIEKLENRPPNDVDLVTFFHLPHGTDQQEILEKHSDLFMPNQLKEKYLVDGYTCLLGEPMENRHVKQVSYWYSMWSHRRNGLWKGFLEVVFSEREDELARKILDSRGQP